MNDRELLELAAKAVGIDLSRADYREHWGFEGAWGVSVYIGRWNPLNNDGDALRLAVDAQVSIEFSYCEDDAPVVIVGDFFNKVRECLAPDFKAKTRRAIVRAAAEIGKAMQ